MNKFLLHESKIMIMKPAQRVVHRVVEFCTMVCLLAAGTFFLPAALAQDTGGDPNLSVAAGQILNMAESGVSDDVILAYIQNDTATFNLSADDVTYLRDEGLTSAVIDAMMNRDKALAQQPPANYTQQLYGGSPPPLPAPVASDTPPPAYVSDAPDEVNYFYSDLSPYGAWVNLEGYGWCWQPTTVVVNRGWQPYCDGGRWVYSDAGWYWESDYSWGWAPFHYGRWFHHDRVGWVWFPDRVWGPAWVTWRTAGNDCGWAPLPLHTTFDASGLFLFNGVRVAANFDFGLPAALFTFVSFNDFAGHDPARHRLPPADVTRIYNRTTIINDYRSDHGNVINHGIPVDRITAVTHTTIRPVPIRPATAGLPRPDNRGGATLAVYRRDVQPPTRPVQVRAQQVDDRHPVVQHNIASTVRRTSPTPGSPVTPARNSGLPPTAPVRQPVTPPSRPVNVNPEPPVRTPAVFTAPAPTTVHGRTPAASSHPANKPEPSPFVAGPDDLPKPKLPTPAPPARSQFDYLPRSSTPAVESHSLPPLPPKPVVPEPAGPPSTVTHDYKPRMAQATEAHALPPLPAPAPTRPLPPIATPAPARSQPPVPAPTPVPARSQPAPSSPSPSGEKSSGGSGSNGSRNGRPNQ